MNIENQFNDALEYLNFNLVEVQNKIKHLDINKNYLEECINRIELDLSKMVDSRDTNAILLSPIQELNKGKQYDSLRDEKENTEQELQETIDKIELLKNEEESLLNIRSCLEINKNQSMSKMEKDGNCDICNFRINESTSIGIDALETQENERKRIARDLHDSTVQNLTNIMHKTELCIRLIDLDTIRAKLELQTMIQTIKTTINDMRNIIYDLRPMSIDDLGLATTIKRYIADYNNKGIEITLNVINENKDVLPIINLSLFRVVQEAINNSIKHGKANRITIKLEYNEEFIELSINDNGIGFNQNESIVKDSNVLTGFGLSIMKERIFLLSGEINISSDNKKGTQIYIKVPLRIQREDC